MSAGKIAQQWDSYVAFVLPTSASDTQRKETKRAFYAGAEAFRRVMLEAPDEDAAALQYCDDLQAEFDAFVAAVQGGVA